MQSLLSCMKAPELDLHLPTQPNPWVPNKQKSILTRWLQAATNETPAKHFYANTVAKEVSWQLSVKTLELVSTGYVPIFK